MNKSTCNICSKSCLDSDLVILKSTTICLSCIKTISDIENNRKLKNDNDNFSLSNDSAVSLYPKDIKHKLDEYIVGQEHAKKVISVAVYNHYKRIVIKNPDIKKSNILIIGPTGCGKTHIVKTLASILNLPIAISVATTLTEEGYIGDSVNSIIEKLYLASSKDIDRTEKGIVFIDEIDKLAPDPNNSSRNVGLTGVQQALLALLEGTKVTIGNRYGFMSDLVEIDTTNILFICGGAFPRLEEIIHKRNGNSADQSSDSSALGSASSLQVTNEDLLEFGLIPEFLGRLPIIVPFEKSVKRC